MTNGEKNGTCTNKNGDANVQKSNEQVRTFVEALARNLDCKIRGYEPIEIGYMRARCYNPEPMWLVVVEIFIEGDGLRCNGELLAWDQVTPRNCPTLINRLLTGQPLVEAKNGQTCKV
jgi:hypothetical protein